MIADYVNDIESPSLTLTDKIALSRYSEGAVKYALSQLRKKGAVSSPVGYLIVCCKAFNNPSNSSYGQKSNIKQSTYGRESDKEVVVAGCKKQSDADRESIDKRSLAYRAQVRGESEEYCLQLQNVLRPFKEVKRYDNDNLMYFLRTKRNESKEEKVCDIPQGQIQTSLSFQEPDLMPQDPIATAQDLPLSPPQLRGTPPQMLIIQDILPQLVTKRHNSEYTTPVMQQESPPDFGDSNIYEEVYDEPGQLDIYN